MGLITHRQTCVCMDTCTHTHLHVSGCEDGTSGQWPHPARHPSQGGRAAAAGTTVHTRELRPRAVCGSGSPSNQPFTEAITENMVACSDGQVAPGRRRARPTGDARPLQQRGRCASLLAGKRASPAGYQAPSSRVDSAPHSWPAEGPAPQGTPGPLQHSGQAASSWLHAPAASAAATCAAVLSAHVLDVLKSTPRPPPQTVSQPVALSTQRMSVCGPVGQLTHPSFSSR